MTIKENKVKNFLAYQSGKNFDVVRSPRDMRYVKILCPLVVAALCWSLGRAPPQHHQTVYQQETVQAPVVQTTGYDPAHFSRLELMDDKNPHIFYPTTAVRQYDGRNFEERSRQVGQTYVCKSLDDLTLRLKLPKEPHKILANHQDHSIMARETNGQYSVDLTFSDMYDLQGMEADPVTGSRELDFKMTIYFPRDDSVPDSVRTHSEEVDQFRLRFIENAK